MRHPSSRKGFDEAFAFAKDSRQYNEKWAEYEEIQKQRKLREIELRRQRKLADEPVDLVNMVKKIAFVAGKF